MTKIKNTVNAIEKMANIAAQEQPLMAEWFNVTVQTVKKIEESIKTNEREFDNVALALTALQCNVGVITIDDIFEPAHEPFDRWIVTRYDITTPTAYGAIVKSSVEGLTAIAGQIKAKMDRIMSLGSMVKIQAMTVDDFKIVLPEDSDDIDEYTPSIEHVPEPVVDVIVSRGSDVSIQTMTSEEIAAELLDTEPTTEEPEETPEEIVEEEPVTEPTLFGVPISQLGIDEIPDAGIGMPTGKREPIKIDERLKPEPQKKKNHQPVCNMPKGSVPVIIGEYDPERFCITPSNNLLDRFKGTIVRTQRMHGKEFVELKDFIDGRLVGKPKTFAMEEILMKAEKIRNQPTPEPMPAEEDTFVYVDWIPDLPKRKYKVYKSGRVYDTVNEQWMQPTARNTINLSAGDTMSKTRGVTCFKTQFMLSSLVWKAFHPENRDLKKIIVNFIDGNPRNCRLDNLVRKAAPKD